MDTGPASRRNLAFIITVAFLNGFVSLAYEIIWLRAFGIAFKGRAGTFGLVVGSYLLGLTVATLLLFWFTRRHSCDYRRLTAWMLFISAVVAYLVVPALAGLMSVFWHMQAIGLGFVFCGAFALGAIFPLVSGSLKTEIRNTGRAFSLVYLASITGGTLGSLLVAFVLFDAFGLTDLSLYLAMPGFFLAGLIFAQQRLAIGAAACGCGLISLLLVHDGLHENVYRKLIFQPHYAAVPPFARILENRHGVITVEQDGTVRQNGVYDTMNLVAPQFNKSEIRYAYALGLIQPRARRVLHIGLATGAWAQVIANLPGVEELTCVEINPAYLDLIREYPEVKSILNNPRINIVIDDGRQWLRKNRSARFDLIVLNSTFHWREQATHLLSREFMRLLKRRLAPGGIVFLNTTRSYSSYLTVKSEFKHVLAGEIYIAASDAPIVPDRARFATALREMRIDGRKVFSLLEKHNVSEAADEERFVFRHLVDIPLGPYTRQASRHSNCGLITDDNMRTEFSSLRSETDCL